MDIKQKFKDFLNLSKEENPSSPCKTTIEELLGLTEISCVLNRKSPSLASDSHTVNQPRDHKEEILDSVEAAFSCQQTDGGRYQLNKLNLISPTLDLNVIRGIRQVLGTQLTGVTLQLFALILQKQSEWSLELENVIDLQDKLDTVNHK